MKAKDKIFTTTYIGEDQPNLNLFKGDRMYIIISRNYINRLYWVTDLTSFITQARKIIHAHRTKGTIY